MVLQVLVVANFYLRNSWFYNDLDNFSRTNHVHDWSSITNRPTAFNPSSHTHDDRYYTESEVTGLLKSYSLNTHNHDTVYSKSNHTHTWDSVTGKPNVFSPSSHNHSWSEISGKPSTYTPSSHNHNDLYYTESEISELLSKYAYTPIFTTEDIGENIEVTYPDNTLICVYEEV